MSGRLKRAITNTTDDATRFTLQRDLRKKGWLKPQGTVNAAWGVALKSLKINGVDCTARESGKRRWAKAVARVITEDTPSRIALLDVHVVLVTLGSYYPVPASNAVIVRHVDEHVDLAWLAPKQPDNADYLEVVPQGSWADIGVDMYEARLDAFDLHSASTIVDAIKALRDHCLQTYATIESRATVEHLIEELASVELD